MANPYIPASVPEGIAWPALPPPPFDRLFALSHQLERSQWWPPETLRRHQFHQLAAVTTHARAQIPFYASRLKGLGRPGGLTEEKWRDVPILARAEVQEAAGALAARDVPKDHHPIGRISTSGSTGRPVTIQITHATSLFFLAMNLRFHVWHRRRFGAKVCAIKVPEAGDTGKPINWVPGHPTGPMVSFDIARPVSEQLQWLVSENPRYLLTYPNNLRELLRLTETTGARLPSLSEVVSMAEVLDPETREECRRLWDVPVSDGYSAQEVGFIALECPDGEGYHLQGENLYVEILDDDGAPARPGEVGRVVVTDFKNYAMPLIRYDVGDYAEMGETCACGRGLAVVNRILGRSRNMLRLPSGARLWPRFASGRMARFSAVRQAQLVQTSFDEIRVRLVVARKLSKDEEAALRDLIGDAIGHPFRLVFEYVDAIPRSASGKFEDFKCEIED